jgi:DNA-directed RNA polymerase specialized sigma24 family protein
MSALASYAYPSGPGCADTDTSREAGEAIDRVLGPLQGMVRAAIVEAGENGLTSHELAVKLGVERTTCQPRTSELRILGKIKDSGQRRPNPNGKRVIVWVAIGGAE